MKRACPKESYINIETFIRSKVIIYRIWNKFIEILPDLIDWFIMLYFCFHRATYHLSLISGISSNIFITGYVKAITILTNGAIKLKYTITTKIYHFSKRVLNLFKASWNFSQEKVCHKIEQWNQTGKMDPSKLILPCISLL